MGKKQFFLITDTESTIARTCADFGAIIVDRTGKIYAQIAVLVNGHYGVHELFYDKNSSDEIWTLKGLKRRNNNYITMLNNGSRMLASVGAINRWLEKAIETYNPTFVAYNASFDIDIMQNTGINTNFKDVFCLWRASVSRVATNKKYIKFCLTRKALTAKLNFKTNAEIMAEFVVGHELPPEPHTALEDILDYELLIFKWLLKSKSYKKYSQNGYNWRNWQLLDLVEPR